MNCLAAAPKVESRLAAGWLVRANKELGETLLKAMLPSKGDARGVPPCKQEFL